MSDVVSRNKEGKSDIQLTTAAGREPGMAVTILRPIVTSSCSLELYPLKFHFVNVR